MAQGAPRVGRARAELYRLVELDSHYCILFSSPSWFSPSHARRKREKSCSPRERHERLKGGATSLQEPVPRRLAQCAKRREGEVAMRKVDAMGGRVPRGRLGGVDVPLLVDVVL